MNVGTSVSGKDKIAKHLVDAGLVSEADLAKANEIQKKDGGSLGQALVRSGIIDETTYTEFMGKVYGLPVVFLDHVDIERKPNEV